jgi:hypothetical protein
MLKFASNRRSTSADFRGTAEQLVTPAQAGVQFGDFPGFRLAPE